MKRSKIKTKVSIAMENYEQHTIEILDSIFESRVDSSCDVSLTTAEEDVPVLAQPVICIPDVDAEILELILRFIYTGEIHVPDKRLNEFIDAGRLLELKSIIVLAPHDDNKKDGHMNKNLDSTQVSNPVANAIRERMALLNNLRLSRQTGNHQLKQSSINQTPHLPNHKPTRDFMGAFTAQLKSIKPETLVRHDLVQLEDYRSFKVIDSVQVVEMPKKVIKAKQCLNTLPHGSNTNQNISENGAKVINTGSACQSTTTNQNKLLRPNHDLTTLANLQSRRDSIVENLMELQNILGVTSSTVPQNVQTFQINGKDFSADLMDDSLDFIEANQWHAYNDPKNVEVDSAATMSFTVEETSCWNDLMNQYPFQDMEGVQPSDRSNIIQLQECNNNETSETKLDHVRSLINRDEYRVVAPAVDDDINLETFLSKPTNTNGIVEDESTESSAETASCCTSLDSGLQADDFPDHVENEIKKEKREVHEAVISALKRGERISAITRKYKVSLTYVYRRKNWLNQRGELPPIHSRISHRKKGTEESQLRLNQSINDVRDGVLTELEACKKYNVSEKTLHMRLRKEVNDLGNIVTPAGQETKFKT